jgi:hypothetical protein
LKTSMTLAISSACTSAGAKITTFLIGAEAGIG